MASISEDNGEETPLQVSSKYILFFSDWQDFFLFNAIKVHKEIKNTERCSFLYTSKFTY